MQKATFELCSLVGSLENSTNRGRQWWQDHAGPHRVGYVTYVLSLAAGLEGHNSGATGLVVADVLHLAVFLRERGEWL